MQTGAPPDDEAVTAAPNPRVRRRAAFAATQHDTAPGRTAAPAAGNSAAPVGAGRVSPHPWQETSMFGRIPAFRPTLAAAALVAAAAATSLAPAAARAQSSVTVNFNALTTTDGTGVVYTNNCYNESGFMFTAAGIGCNTAQTFAAFGPDAGVASPSLVLNDPSASFVDITRVGGGAFSMSSLALAPFDYAMTTNVSLIGTLMGGGTVTQACPTLTGAAFATTFSTCSLTQFAGMNFTSVRLSSMNNYGEAYVFMDNLVFTPSATTVPEPATVALLGAGLLAVGAAARRRRA